MKRLGYSRYVAQGGDWGAIVVDLMATQGHQEVLGIHSNMPGVIPPEIDKAAAAGSPAPSGLSADEKRAYETLALTYKNFQYGYFMGSRPQTLYGIADVLDNAALFWLTNTTISAAPSLLGGHRQEDQLLWPQERLHPGCGERFS